ncbi:MAG: aminoglycoside phosphotransferase family protein [Planctomycetota bacterium]
MADHLSWSAVWQDFIARHLGAPISESEVLAPRIWRVQGPRGQAVLKLCSSARAYSQECEAHDRWADRYCDTRDLSLARILGRTDFGEGEGALSQRALLFEWVPGRALTDEMAHNEEFFRRAGRALSILHNKFNLPQGTALVNDLDLAEALEARAESLRDFVCASEAAAETKKQLLSWLENWSSFRGRPRVFCHRDYEPRNWILDLEGRFWVVDFEHARFDDWLSDLLRLREGIFFERPKIEAAFLAGHGKDLAGDDLLCLRRWEILHALQTISWAQRYGDSRFERRAYRLLNARLKADGLPAFG